jgi:membrane-associated phospholipid phosphatase
VRLRVGLPATVLALSTALVLWHGSLPGDRVVDRLVGRPYRTRWRPLSEVVAVVSPEHLAVLLVVVGVLVALLRRRSRTAAYVLAVAVATTAAVVALKGWTWRSGPQGRTDQRWSSSFPSGHLTWLVVGGESLLAVLGRRSSAWLIGLGAVVAAMVWALLRLRAHWLGDLVGAAALSALLIAAARWLRAPGRPLRLDE